VILLQPILHNFNFTQSKPIGGTYAYGSHHACVTPMCLGCMKIMQKGRKIIIFLNTKGLSVCQWRLDSKRGMHLKKAPLKVLRTSQINDLHKR
jgi:hypothetical protein